MTEEKKQTEEMEMPLEALVELIGKEVSVRDTSNNDSDGTLVSFDLKSGMLLLKYKRYGELPLKTMVVKNWIRIRQT